MQCFRSGLPLIKSNQITHSQIAEVYNKSKTFNKILPKQLLHVFNAILIFTFSEYYYILYRTLMQIHILVFSFDRVTFLNTEEEYFYPLFIICIELSSVFRA